MRYAEPGVNLICDEFAAFSGKPTTNKKTDIQIQIRKEITLRNLSFQYPGAAQAALRQINLRIPAGSVIGIIGQSGSGKTTLVNILTGLLHTDEGQILLDDEEVTQNMQLLQACTGYVPQAIFLLDDTLEKNIAFGVPAAAIDHVRIQRVIEQAKLGELVAQLPMGIHAEVGERGIKLSGGQRQRIGIARALYHQPQLLILDEGTSALDIETESAIMESVAALKGTITMVLIAHRYSSLQSCDRIYKMDNGSIVASGIPEQITQK
jgi:ATP-binding cassette subfamily C protein